MGNPSCHDLGGVLKGKTCTFQNASSAQKSCQILHGKMVSANTCQLRWSWIEWIELCILIGTLIWMSSIWANRNNPSMWTLGYWIGGSELSSVSFWNAVGICALFTIVGGLIPISTPYVFSVGIFAYEWMQESSAYGIAEVLLLIGICAIIKVFSDIVDYWLGLGTERLIRKTDPALRDRWSQKILAHPQWIPAFIVLFGSTPLPDEILAFPLGVVKYSQWKTLFWMFVGAILMFGVVVLGSVGGILLLNEIDPTGWILSVIMIGIVMGCLLFFLHNITKK